MQIKTIPIIHLKDNLYFIGIYKVLIEMKGDFLMVKVGNKIFERLADYLKQNKEKFEQKLVVLSLKNENIGLVDVVNNLITRTYMNGMNNSFMTNMSFSRASIVSGLSSKNSKGGTLFKSGGVNSTNSLRIPGAFSRRLSEMDKV